MAASSQPVLRHPQGTRIRVRAISIDEAQALQNNHGGWVLEMGPMLGKTGVITQVHGRTNKVSWVLGSSFGGMPMVCRGSRFGGELNMGVPSRLA